MARLHINFCADAPDLSVAMDVILPQSRTRRSEQKLPVRWLWPRRTSIERNVATMIQRVLAWLPLPETRTA